MNILLTGNLGYIGSVLTGLLLERGHSVTGLDTDYYFDTELYPAEKPTRQIKKDIRDVSASDLAGIDAVIHLAALSNDPLGEFDSSLTDRINFEATVRLAKLAKEAGVKRFVYSSSQSMYGVSDTDAELDEDSGKKNPVTAYGRTKWESEKALKELEFID